MAGVASGRAASAVASLAVLLVLTGCSPTAEATSSESGDYVVVTVSAPGDVSGQARADGALTLTGPCVALDVGDGPVLAIFPRSTTPADDGSIRFPGGAVWHQGEEVSASGSASAFDELDPDIASTIPDSCTTDHVFFVTESAGALRSITSIGIAALGSSVCNYGFTRTVSNCATIQNTSWCGTTSAGVNLCRMVLTNGTFTQGGDSGGPWYITNTALGIHSGALLSNGWAIYGRADNAQAILGVTIKLS